MTDENKETRGYVKLNYDHQPEYSRRLHIFLYFLPSTVLIFGISYLLFQINKITNGRFVYSLDDPYIHLSLAEKISHGFYGINFGEPAAPSSSIIWPFLLVPFSRATWFEYVPLVLNSLFALLTLIALIRIVSWMLRGLSPARWAAGTVVIASAFIPATNLVGVIFTGMEHNLQVLMTVLIMIGMIKTLYSDQTPAWFIAVLVFAPLVRYECLAFVLPALIVLAYKRRWSKLSISIVLLAIGLGGFSLYLRSQGLGWLPSSVIAKITYVDADTVLSVKADSWLASIGQALLTNVLNQMIYTQGWTVVLIFLLLTGRALTPVHENSGDRKDRVFASCAALGMLLHLLFGRTGWWGRYELYAISSGLIALVMLARHPIQFLIQKIPWFATPIIFLVIALFGLDYNQNYLRTPDAARDIYEQQYQMHRFVSNWYNAPVAVNDLGWVSYRNPYYVLDLWGLASYEALDQRKSAADSAWMAVLAEKHDIKLAMIYTDWFSSVPDGWTPVAHLHLSNKATSAGGDMVTFYALAPTDIDAICADLEDFKATLPKGVRLDILE